jgi:hypothetical protein
MHSKLITALRTVVENGEGVLDKEATSHDTASDIAIIAVISTGIPFIIAKKKYEPYFIYEDVP